MIAVIIGLVVSLVFVESAHAYEAGAAVGAWLVANAGYISAATAAVSAAGTAVSAISASQSAEANEKLAKAEAQQRNINAAAEQEAHRIKIGQITSRQEALIGKSGVQATGSPLGVVLDTIAEGELEGLNIRAGAKQFEGAKKFEASMFRSQGKNAILQGGFDAVGNAASVLGSFYSDEQRRRNRGKVL